MNTGMKRILTAMLSDILAVSLLVSAGTALPASAAEEERYDGLLTGIEEINIYDEEPDYIEMPEADAAFLSEEGSNQTVYISTVDDLRNMQSRMRTEAGYSRNKTFVLLNNIDLGGGEWEPMGYNSAFENGTTSALLTYAFNGVFDGNGYTISNFRITNDQYKYLGFFGCASFGTIKNLNLENAVVRHIYNVSGGAYGDVHYPEYAALLVGFSNYATIENCNVAGTVNIINDTQYRSGRYISAGMITGGGVARISGCGAVGSMSLNTLTNIYCGGIFGNAGTSSIYFRGFIKNCSSSVSINVQNASLLYAGGIIGRSSTSIDEISDCKFTSAVFAQNSRTDGGNTGDMPVYAGGIAGYSYTPIISCSSGTGRITASSESAPHAGGIAGRSAQRIENCTVDNSISSLLPSSAGTGTASIGGIAGICGSSYSSSSSLAPVDKNEIPAITGCTVSEKTRLTADSASGGFTVAGGIAGTLYAPSVISDCESAPAEAELSASKAGIYFGGIAGYLNGGEITGCRVRTEAGNKISSASTLYLGGIAGISRVKQFYTYDMSRGVKDSSLYLAKIYGSRISGCSAEVDLTAGSDSASYTGGLVGYVSGIYSSSQLHVLLDRDIITERSEYTGSIALPENSAKCYAGGLAAYVLDGQLRDCCSTGSIVSNAEDSVERYIGGAVGCLKQANHNEPEVFSRLTNCYSYMSIDRPEGADATKTDSFCAELSPSAASGVEPAAEGCYCFGSSAMQNGVQSLSANDFTKQSSFEGWDFDTVWKMGVQRPILTDDEGGTIPTPSPTSSPTPTPTPTPTPSPQAEYTAGTDGDITWNYSNGELLISGSGHMPDHDAGGTPWYHLREKITTITVSDGVDRIGNNAFSGLSQVMRAVLPDTVRQIGNNAFGGCGSLSSIELPEAVTEIGEAAFEGCAGLRRITIPEGIRTLNSHMFRGCSALMSIEIPSGTESIGEGILEGCIGLIDVKAPYVGANADPGDEAVTPEGIFGYFFGVKSNAEIPASVTKVEITGMDKDGYIPMRAFADCRYICDIIIDGGRDILDEAFKGCVSLKDLYIPKSTASIGKTILADCQKLETLTVPFIGTNRLDHDTETSVLGSFFGYDDGNIRGTLQYYNESGSHYYKVPRTLKNIAVLSQTTIPYGAFSGCDFIERAAVVSGARMNKWAFYNCRALKEAALPYDLQEIGEQAFAECEALETINIPDRVKTIGAQAFYGARSLKNVTMPESVTDIADDVFNGSNLAEGEAGLMDAGGVITCSDGSGAHKYAEAHNIRTNIVSSDRLVIRKTMTSVTLLSDDSYLFDVTYSNASAGSKYGKLNIELYGRDGRMTRKYTEDIDEVEYRAGISGADMSGISYARVYISGAAATTQEEIINMSDIPAVTIKRVGMSYSDGSVSLDSEPDPGAVLVEAFYTGTRLDRVRMFYLTTETKSVAVEAVSGAKLMLWKNENNPNPLGDAIEIE